MGRALALEVENYPHPTPIAFLGTPLWKTGSKKQ